MRDDQRRSVQRIPSLAHPPSPPQPPLNAEPPSPPRAPEQPGSNPAGGNPAGGDPRRWARKPLSVAERVWAIAVPTVTVLAIVITAVAALGERQSSVENLSVRGAGSAETPADAALPVEEYETIGAQDPYWFESNADRFSDQWLIPASAPIQSFPEEPKAQQNFYLCSDAQLAWLREHAQQTSGSWSHFRLTLHSSATSGGALSLNNIRFDGAETPSEPLIHFQCPQGGKGSHEGQIMYITADGTPARWGPEKGTDAKPEGSPVTLNIAPGEASALQLVRAPEVDTQRLYEGRFLADVVETGKTVVLAGDISFRREMAPGYFFGYGWNNDPQLYCETPGSERTPCSIGEAAEVLRAAKKAAAE